MWLFDAILKDEEYENKVWQAQQQAAAHLDIVGGVAGGWGWGGWGSWDPATGGVAGGWGWVWGGGGGGWSWVWGDGSGAGWVWGGGSGWTGDGSTIVSSVSSSPTDILSLTEEPLIITDDGTVSTSVEPTSTKSILDDIAQVTAAAEAGVATETTEWVEDALSEVTTEEQAPTEVTVEWVDAIPEEIETPTETVEEPVAMVEEEVETSPAGVLRESIAKLEHLEEIDKSVLEDKIEEAQGYKEKANEYKALEKTAKEEAVKIEGEIEHIEEIISNFEKELEKEEQSHITTSKAE